MGKQNMKYIKGLEDFLWYQFAEHTEHIAVIISENIFSPILS